MDRLLHIDTVCQAKRWIEEVVKSIGLHSVAGFESVANAKRILYSPAMLTTLLHTCV